MRVRFDPLPCAEGDEGVAAIVDGGAKRLRICVGGIELEELWSTILEESGCIALITLRCHWVHGDKTALVTIPAGQQRHMGLFSGSVCFRHRLGEQPAVNHR